MRDEGAGRDHTRGADGSEYRVRLSGTSHLRVGVALTIAVGLMITAAGASKYVVGQSSGSSGRSPGSTIAASTQTSSPPSSAPDRPTPNLPVIAWTDATPTPAAKPSPGTPARPQVEQCAARNLKFSAVAQPWGRSAGNEIQILLTNAGSVACYLVGAPYVAVEQGGHELALPFQPADIAAGSVTLAPGEQAVVEVGFGSICAPDFTKPASVTIQIWSGAMGAPVDTAQAITGACIPDGAAASTMTVFPFQPYAPAVASTETTTPAQVEATEIDLPDFAVAGQTMTYSIVLTNTGDTVASLDPCPGYSQSLPGALDHDGAGGFVYVLNCAAMGWKIAPRTSVRLAMVYNVPADTPAGKQTFFWESYSGSFQAAIKALLEVRQS